MFLAETPSETTHAIELVDHFDATHLFIILLKLGGVTSYFKLYSPSIAEYENDDIQRFILMQRSHLGIHLQVNTQTKKLEC